VFPPLMLILHPLLQAHGTGVVGTRCGAAAMASLGFGILSIGMRIRVRFARDLRHGCARNQDKATHPSSIPEAD